MEQSMEQVAKSRRTVVDAGRSGVAGGLVRRRLVAILPLIALVPLVTGVRVVRLLVLLAAVLVVLLVLLLLDEVAKRLEARVVRGHGEPSVDRRQGACVVAVDVGLRAGVVLRRGRGAQAGRLRLREERDGGEEESDAGHGALSGTESSIWTTPPRRWVKSA